MDQNNSTLIDKTQTQDQVDIKETKQYPIALILVLSFLFGVIGGVYGALDLSQRDVFKRWFGQSASSSTYNQQIIVDEESAVTNVVKESGPAVVSIVISKDVGSATFDPFGFFGQQPNSSEPNIQEVGAGTGFFVSADGLIMTNRHVVSDETAQYSVLTNDGQSYEATVLTTDTVNDLAFLKIDIQDAPFLEFADSSHLELGQQVVAIGNSLGQYQNTVTTGVISGIDRDIYASDGGSAEQLEGVIQTDAAINPGNSGGPLLDLAGNVVGINTAIDRQGQLVGFAIPANDARAALISYQEHGKIVRPFLGIRYVMLSPAMAQAEDLPRDYGAYIVPSGNGEASILSDSPAAQAGLAEGDIILQVESQKLDGDLTLAQELKQYSPGDIVKFTVYKSESQNEIEVTITLGER
ncbi:MAG: trypsin-like peptidase domain-containing protein [Candidatus Doudnabacteria bacterium]